MDHTGWVKLHRNIVNWEWYQDQNTKALFMHLLATVNHSASTYRGYPIPPGSGVYGYRKLALQTGLTISKIRTALNNLEMTHEITRRTTRNFTIISIAKWDQYQGDRTAGDSDITFKSHSDRTQIAQSKECKNERKNLFSDENSPEDPREALFSDGVRIITARGVPDRQARSFIGKCLKLSGDDAVAVLQVLRDAEAARPASMQDWVMAHFKTGRQGASKQEAAARALKSMTKGGRHG